MKNNEVAKVLNRLADFMDMDGLFFQMRAYRTAATNVETLTEDIEIISKEERLEDIPGVGKNIASKIKEYLDTGKVESLEELKEEYPIDFDELLTIEGLGLKTIKRVFLELGVYNIETLENAAKNQELRKLKGLGPKSETNILKNIDYAKNFKGRMLLYDAYYLSEKIKEYFLDLDFVKNVEVAGSVRRGKETCGDIDILITTNKVDFQHNSSLIMDHFSNLDIVINVTNKGPLKSTAFLKQGLDCDIRVFNESEIGAALMYFTGSKETNVEMRKLAISKNMKLSEYGLFKIDENGEETLIASETEEKIFNSLGMEYIPPELRENLGEVEASLNSNLPDLVDLSNIKGDLHCHTINSDGFYSISDMAKSADELGYEYLAITDHAKLPVANGLSDSELLSQMDEIDDINPQFKVKILKGVETNINMNGDIDVSEDILEELDVVVASIHNGLNNPAEVMTNRLIKAAENDLVDIIGHPTGRRLTEREAYNLNFDSFFESCKDNNTYVEINSSKLRLDLKDIHIKRAIENNCKLVINTDAHKINSLKTNMKFGVLTARRGWAENKDILNTLPLKDMLNSLK